MAVKNVVMIVSDTLRRDHLGCYGNRWIRTPHLDRFAEKCVVFYNAYVGNFPTVPARLEYFTGRYSSAYFEWAPFPRDEVALAEVLTGAAFNTMCISDTMNLFRDGYNFDRGFRGFEWIRGQSGDRFRTSPIDPPLPCAEHKLFYPDKFVRQYLRNISWRRVEEDYFPAQTFRAAATWLEGNYQSPFFLYLDTFDPHEPWDPP
jgi:arylsulfatase A-like enzyme